MYHSIRVPKGQLYCQTFNIDGPDLSHPKALLNADVDLEEIEKLSPIFYDCILCPP